MVELDIPLINPAQVVQAVIRPLTKSSGRNQSVPRTLGRSIACPSQITELACDGNCRLTLHISGTNINLSSDQAEERTARRFDKGELSIDHNATSSDMPFTQHGHSIHDLPTEIQGAILDFLFGDLASVAPTSDKRLGSLISASMRHPRRKELADMALVSDEWRHLVQERIYRHVKLKATNAGLEESRNFLMQHSHLTQYIRHVEFWIPIWGDRSSVPLNRDVPQMSLQLQREYQDNTGLLPNRDSSNLSFKRSQFNATLSDIFRHVSCFLPNAQILTLEGGHCLNSPLVALFNEKETQDSLECLPQVKTLALKGAWNILRDYVRWQKIEKALPNLQAWHCSYPDSRHENYTLFWKIGMHAPPTIRLLDVNMSSLRTKENTAVYNDMSPAGQHVCYHLGKMTPQLESLSFSGRICSNFFSAAATAARESKFSCRLRNIDLVVGNCCRTKPTMARDDDFYNPIYDRAPGQFNLDFIRCFERLIVSCVRSLKFLPLENIRIRFIDFEAACPQLNPYFRMVGNRCYGIWNEEILNLLPNVRPGLQYANLEEGLANPLRKEDGPTRGLFPLRRPKAIKSSTYRIIAESRV